MAVKGGNQVAEKPYRPRLSIEISRQQQDALSRLVPWGVKNALFSVIVDDVIDRLERHGHKFIAIVLDHKLKLGDYTRFSEEEDGYDK